MAEAGNADFPTILGPDAVFKGDLSYDKGLRLQGRFEGKINTPGKWRNGRRAGLRIPCRKACGFKSRLAH